MAESSSIFENPSKRVSWSKGKIVGAKPPLRRKRLVCPDKASSRRTSGTLHSLSSPSTASSVSLKVDDIAPGGYAADRASVRQKKTSRPVKFQLTEATRQAVDDYLKVTVRGSENICSPADAGPTAARPPATL